MIERYLSKNQNEGLAAYGKYYPRVSYKQTMNIHDMDPVLGGNHRGYPA